MITHEMIEAQRKLYSKPIVIGDVAIKVLTARNRHFGILDGVSIPGKTIVEIDPGFAFGDGAHPTTRMCVEAIQNHIKHGVSVLDIGCGCGILSIVALLLGASSAKAVDIDPAAVMTAKRNAELNGVSDRIITSVGDLVAGIWYKCDIIVANILADPLIKLLQDLPVLCNKDTVVILGGIRDHREAEVMAAANNNFRVVERAVSNGWVCLTLAPK